MASSWDKLGQAASVMQVTGVDAFGLVSMIVQAAHTARRNRDLCQQLAQHVLIVDDLLRKLDIPELNRHPETRRPLAKLDAALFCAFKLVRHCGQQQEKTGQLYQMFTGASMASKLRQAEEEIDRYINLIPMITAVAFVRTKGTQEVYEDVNNDSGPSIQRHRLSLREVTELLALEEVPPRAWVVSQKDHGGAPQLKGAKFFSSEELKSCTNNFLDELGSGGYGKVYKGILEDGTVVSIKRAGTGSMQGVVEFKNEIELLSRVHHGNLVSLIGGCSEQGEQMLVYEYVSNGTLREHLRVGRMHLDWKKRLKIALDSARGLAYLHMLSDPPIIHGNIKSTNILLDDNLKAKVADFGLSKLVADTQKGHVSTQVKGTLGYLDSEYYYMRQQLSEKSDVYSFGAVMLELVSPTMMDDAACSAELGRFVKLAMRCMSAAGQPTMGEVVKEIEDILQNDRGHGFLSFWK